MDSGNRAEIARLRVRTEAALDVVEESCVECGECTQRCSLLENRGWTIRSVCQETRAVLEEAGSESEDANIKGADSDIQGVDNFNALYQVLKYHSRFLSFILSCAGCDRCTALCPQSLSMSVPWKQGRMLARAAGYISDADLGIVQVDCTWDSFSVFRAIQGIDYGDLPLLCVEPIDAQQEGWIDPRATAIAEAPQAKTLFFPGCTLATYAPELTRAAYAWIVRNVGSCLLTTQCCGVTLDFMGESERAAAWKKRLVEAAHNRGVARIVCACPGCAATLAPVADTCGLDIEFVPLARLMVDSGVRVGASTFHTSALPVMVVDSCNDRTSSYGNAIRHLFEDVESVCSPCRGADARCCGAGGGVNLFNKAAARNRTQQMVSIGQQLGAHTLITACPTCTYTFALERWEHVRDDDELWNNLDVFNYLEIVFGKRIDWPAVFEALADMWQGSYASWVISRLT